MHPPAGSQVSRVPAQRTPPGQVVPPPLAPPPAPRKSRLRLILAVVSGVAALLCLSGIAVGYVLYDNATAPDRSAPDVVVDNYLRAFLVDRNDVQAGQYACPDTSALTELRNLRTDLQEREQRFQTTFRVSWGSLDVRRDGNSAEVRVDLTISTVVNEISQSDRQAWRFVTRLEDDWRVCEAGRAA
ncbi:hypothetical protein ACWDV4_05035 [Micromonospora sp. NPDC003197]